MSQIVYTELEGYPLRWEYKGAVPTESKKDLSREPKTWSVSTTPTTQIQNANVGTDNVVYGANQVAQVFKMGTNAIKVTAIQLYGRKVGAPPNPLQVEIRKPAMGVATSTSPTYDQRPISEDGRTTDISAPFVMTLSPNLPAGDNVIIVTISGYYESAQFGVRRKGSATYLRSKTLVYHLRSLFSFAATDPGAPAGQEYEIVLISGGSRWAYNWPIKIWALVVQGAAFTQFDNVTTNPLASLSLAAGKWLVIGMAHCNNNSGVGRWVGPGRLYVGTTLIAEGPGAVYIDNGWTATITVAGFLDTTSPATVRFEMASISGTFSGELIAIPVSAGAYGRVVLNTGLPRDAWGTITSASFTATVGDKILAVATMAGSVGLDSPIRFGIKRGGVVPSRFSLAWRYQNLNAFLGATFTMTSSSITIDFEGYNLRHSDPYPGVSYVIAKPTSNFWSVEYQIANSDNKIVASWTETEWDQVIRIDMQLPLYRIGTPGDVTVEVRKGSATGPLLGSTTIAASSIPGDGTLVSATVSLSEQIYRNDNVYIIIKSTGTGDNYYLLKSVACHEETVSGKPKGVVSAVYVFMFKTMGPGETVIASTSIAPANVGTTNAWISIPLSTPLVLRPNEFFAIVVYTIGGDAGNYYAVQKGASSLTGYYEVFLYSNNAGSSWIAETANDLSFKLDGVGYVKIYSGTIPSQPNHPLGAVLLQLSVLAQTSGGMEFAGFDDFTLAAPVTSSTSASLAEVIVLRPTDKRNRDVTKSTIDWEIWAAGSGLATRAYRQMHVHMTKNPIYPSDFGFSELYLIRSEVGPGGLVALNDNVVGGIYNSSTSTQVKDYELFRIPVRKVEVIAEPTNGGIVLHFIGIE